MWRPSGTSGVTGRGIWERRAENLWWKLEEQTCHLRTGQHGHAERWRPRQGGDAGVTCQGQEPDKSADGDQSTHCSHQEESKRCLKWPSCGKLQTVSNRIELYLYSCSCHACLASFNGFEPWFMLNKNYLSIRNEEYDLFSYKETFVRLCSWYSGQGDGPPWVSPVQLHQRSSHENPGWKVHSFLTCTDVLVVWKVCVIHQLCTNTFTSSAKCLTKEPFSYRGIIRKKWKLLSPTFFCSLSFP